MNKKIIFLFDLDGVLIDSKKNMKVSWEAVNKKYNLKIAFDKYFSNIGLPFFGILKKIKVNNSLFEKIAKEYRKNSLKNLNYIKLFKGVKKVLKKLKNEKKIIGVFTSKERVRTIKILKKFGLKINILLCPSRNIVGKPNPEQIYSLLKKTKLNKKDVVYVGDMSIDKITAKNARIDYIHALYGYSKITNNKYSINRIEDIIKKNLGVY